MFDLRDWQAAAVLAVHAELRRRAGAGARPAVLATAPTGTGKGVVASWLQLSLPREWDDGPCAIVSPRCEILAGIAQKQGKTAWKPKELQKMHLWTPIRLRNALRQGKAPDYGSLILDEGHHATADSWQEVLLAHYGCPAVGLTATGFRGTPKETLKLRELWGEPLVLRSWTAAAAAGDLAVPRCEVRPLLNDDVVTVGSTGDFQVSALEAAGLERIDSLVGLIEETWAQDRRPMLVSLPSRNLINEAAVRLTCPYVIVTEDTPAAERQEAFRAAAAGVAVLLQITVVSEGVDLPSLRVWIDGLPTLSPVRWTQTLGRITRPSGSVPRVICTNRNLERFCYLLEGLIPREDLAQAQQAFGGPSQRLGAHRLGLEALGRFKPIEIPLEGGLKTHGFALRAWDEASQRQKQYFCVVAPTSGEVIFAGRENVKMEDDKWGYGKWKAIPIPSDLQGFATSPKAWEPSEKQMAWWQRDAIRYGLDPLPPREVRAWQVLPVLAALGRKVK